MSAWDWLRAAVGVFRGTSGSGRAMLEGLYRGRIGEPPIRSTQNFLELYETSPWVRAVAGKVAAEVGATQWQLKRSDRDEPVKDNLMLSVLRRPNTLMTGQGLMRVTQLSLDLVGDAFWLKQRNGFGAPTAFWPIPAHWIPETPTPERPRYRVSWRGWQAEIPETEMVWFHDASPVDPYRRGSGIVRALGDELETDEFAAKHAKTLFFNRATPEFVVQDPGASLEEVERHEQHWNEKLQGLFRAMKPYFVNRKLEFWQPTTPNLENLTLVPLRQFERDVQLQCWGMPPEQLGIIENSNRATIDASDYVYQTRLIKPRRDFLAEELTLKLAPEYDARLQVTYVPTIPADKEYQLNVMKAAPWAFGESEWRAAAGKDKHMPAGDLRMVPMNSYVTDDPMDLEQRPQSAGAAAPAGEEPKEDDAPKKLAVRR